jgi:hypothetical protein
MTKSGSESGVDQPCFNGIYGSTGGDLYHRCQSPIPPVKLPRSGRAAGRARGQSPGRHSLEGIARVGGRRGLSERVEPADWRNQPAADGPQGG